MHLEDVFDDFLNYLQSEKNVSNYTIENYSSDFKIFLHFLCSSKYKMEVDSITTPIIRKYLAYLKNEKQYKNNTMRRKIHSLSSFFKFLLEQEYIIKNPMSPVHAPKLEKTIPIYLNEKELRRLISMPIKHSRDNKLRDKCILECLAMTGVRRNELLSLNWEDIDFGEKFIKVVKGKGKKQRIVPITEPLVSDLWAYLQTRLPLFENAVFISSNETRMSTTAIEQLFRRYIKLAGLEDRGFTIHKLRSTYASLLIQNGVDIFAIQELLGHEDLNSTKIYTRVTTGHLRNEVMKFPLSSE